MESQYVLKSAEARIRHSRDSIHLHEVKKDLKSVLRDLSQHVDSSVLHDVTIVAAGPSKFLGLSKVLYRGNINIEMLKEIRGTIGEQAIYILKQNRTFMHDWPFGYDSVELDIGADAILKPHGFAVVNGPRGLNEIDRYLEEAGWSVSRSYFGSCIREIM